MKKPVLVTALLEIGMEEIPARFLDPALEQLKGKIDAELRRNNIPFTSIETWGTPRRLAALISGLAPKASDRVDEAVGPSPKAAKDEAGHWTQAALGFAKAQKIPVEKLIVKETPKGERLVALHPVKGQKTDAVLKELFPAVIKSLTFPKSMVWEESRFRFARPIRKIVALYNSKVVRFRVAGISSDRATTGLLALGGQKITISKPERYKMMLKDRCILVDQKDRVQKIERELDSMSKRVKCKVVTDADHIKEVANLTAYPVAILGQFNATYLSLPREILTVVLRKHQKFFPLESGKGLSNYFIGVRNGPSEYQDDVRDGYERVVHARFADAKFFFEHDSQIPLETLAPKLSGVGFHAKLGSLWDKTVRVRAIAQKLCSLLPAVENAAAVDRVALLAKADLLTQMVGEFPELQGVAGRFYSQATETADVAASIEQHYWPLTSEGALPKVTEAAVVAVADKIDTLAADFSIGLVPSGSADPYGLRRAAIGLIRILLDRKWSVTLDQLVDLGFEALSGDAAAKAKAVKDVRDFLVNRAANLFKDQGYRVDEIEAVLSNGNQSVSVVAEKLAGLKSVRGKPEFGSLASAIKRARNLLTQAKEKGTLPLSQDMTIEELSGEHEKNLLTAVHAVRPKLSTALEHAKFHEAFLQLSEMKAPVDAFFEGVMVMTEDEKARSQRLQLLMLVKEMFDSLADFSKLQVSSS